MIFMDSYDSLAVAIERNVRSDVGPPASDAKLAASIDRRLREEARTGELGLAYVRAGVAIVNVMLSLWSVGSPRPTTSMYAAGGLVFRTIWLALAIALLLALRRGWYRLWLRRAVPIGDAVMILGSFVLLWGTRTGKPVDIPPAAVGYVVVLCSFLAVSGTMRLSHLAADLSTGLAVGVFLLAALAARLPTVPTLATCAILLLLGYLGRSATTVIRRVVMHEVARMELSRLYADARDAIDAREEVLKIVSHDLRNPLHTIAMSAELLLESDMPGEQRDRQLAIIRRAGERMNRLVQDLLDVAKLEAGRLSISRRAVRVSSLLSEAEEMLRPLAEEHGIRFTADGETATGWLQVDAGRVQQALGNLVGNAIKFTPRGGRITVRAESVNGAIRFSVSDSGTGIPQEQLSHIFGPFWQAHPADRRGIGLGLAITKAIVEAHGGRIWVESHVGAGTTFYFTLESPQRSSSGLLRSSASAPASQLSLPH